MTVLEAALKGNVLEAAHAYLAAGISVVPLYGQKPSFKGWTKYQKMHPAASTVMVWQANGLLSGVGVICGGISGNLVVMDLNGHEAIAEYRATFPTLSNTMTVITGSRHGMHFYYYVDDLPETIGVPQFELQSTGAYVVAAPSPTKTGILYKAINRLDPLRLQDMTAVVEWIESKRPTPPQSTEPNPCLIPPTPELSN
jgi:hypothetical protein